MTQMDLDVTVVGGGIGGMTATLMLARAGAAVTMLERHSGPRAVGAGILLQPNGLAVLDGLGLRQEIEDVGQIKSQFTLRDDRGAVLTQLATPDFGDGLGHMVAIRRADLHEVLHRALERESRAFCRFECEVSEVDASGTVEIDWRGQAGTVSSHVVVGADGIHSIVRRSGDFKATLGPPSGPYIRCLVRPRESVHLQGEHWTSLGLFGGSQVDEDTVYFYASASHPSVRDALRRRDLTALRNVWASELPVAGTVLDLIENLDDLLVNEAVRVDCETWFDGRLVLIGDAAHAMSPTVGQGANSAMLDAVTLTEELVSGAGLSASLERFQRRRMPLVRRIQGRGDALAKAAELRSPIARRMRNGGVRMLGRLPGASERMVTMMQQEDSAELAHRVRAVVQESLAGDDEQPHGDVRS